MDKDNKATSETKNSPSGFGKKKLIISIIIGLLVVGGAAFYYLSSEETNMNNTLAPSDPVARVNGEEITQSELDATQQQVATSQGADQSLIEGNDESLKTETLNLLISRTLLRQRVESHGINVTQEDIDSRLTELRSNFESEEIFQQQLSEQGITEEALVSQIESEIEMQMFLEEEFGTESFAVSDAEIEQFYEQSVEQQEDGPSLEEVRPQLEQMIVQQKQQQKLAELVQELQLDAEIEILI